MADRPVHEIRLGRVKAAIWRNEGEFGTRHNVTISRIYKTEDSWETSASFGRDDLPLVEKVSALAQIWIYQHAERDAPESDEVEQPDARRNGKRPAAR